MSFKINWHICILCTYLNTGLKIGQAVDDEGEGVDDINGSCCRLEIGQLVLVKGVASDLLLI